MNQSNQNAKTSRSYISALVTLSLYALGAALQADHAADDSPTRPNLLIIQTDEHHYGTLGCYGGEVITTPHIDGLARDGALATSFYATTPVCSPSRAALVSGLYPQNTPVVTNNIPLADDIVTFAEILRRQGWATGYAGKWHLDGTAKPGWAPARKFGFEDNRYLFNRGHWKHFEITDEKKPRVAARNAKGQPSYGVEGADERSFSTDWLTDRTIDFIRDHKDEPFCYMLSLPDPHGPNTVRAPYDSLVETKDVPVPKSLTRDASRAPGWGKPNARMQPGRLRQLMTRYYGMVKCIDDNVGRILNALDDAKILERTIVVFTADHGDLCGEHGRLNKGVPFEGSARIPFVVRYPRKIPSGTVVREALSCVDFAPTVLRLMGVEHERTFEGRDASRLLAGRKAATENPPEPWDDVTVLRSTSGNNRWLCAVTDRYKLVYSNSDRPWFFDLEEDSDELQNRFGDEAHRATIERLTRTLADYGKRFGDPYVKDEAIRAGLEAVLSVGEGR